MNKAIFRILDADFNRAREALRVMEEYARFVLDDAHLTNALKHMRHALADAVGQMDCRRASVMEWGDPAAGDTGSLVSHRDITHDVGRNISTHQERQRDDAAQVAKVACKRLSEALRVLEEYGKVVSPTISVEIERLRYQAYEIERRLLSAAQARRRLRGARLYVILTSSLCHLDWLETAQLVLAGGADIVQLREKDLDDGELLARATRLAALCHDQGAIFMVNDRPDVAVLAGADGVHVGQDDLPVADVRRIVGGDAVVGLSTHTIEQVEAACEAAPDYIAVGPMYATATKPRHHTAGLETLRAARERTSLPLVAIGGIGERHVQVLFDHGADCVCICSEIIAQADVPDAVRRIRARIDEAYDTTGGNHS